jgi:acyl-CoA thioesterase
MDHQDFLEYMNTARNFNTHNGFRVVELREEYCVAEVDLTRDGMNPQGVAHGSLLFGLCDEVTGLAAASTGRSMLTLDASIHFLRPGTGKTLRAESVLIKNGRTTGLFEAKVTDDEGRLVAKGEFTVYYTGSKVDISERRARDKIADAGGEVDTLL